MYCVYKPTYMYSREVTRKAACKFLGRPRGHSCASAWRSKYPPALVGAQTCHEPAHCNHGARSLFNVIRIYKG